MVNTLLSMVNEAIMQLKYLYIYIYFCGCFLFSVCLDNFLKGANSSHSGSIYIINEFSIGSSGMGFL